MTEQIVPVAPPDGVILPQSFNLQLVSGKVPLRSFYTNKTQTVDFPGHRWRVVLDFQDLNYEESLLLHQFLAFVVDNGGFFKAYHAGRPTPLVATGSGTASGSGRTITVSGVSGLKSGDMIGVGSELKMVTQDQTGNSVRIAPALRNPVSGASVTLNKPMAKFYCTNPETRVAFRHGNSGTLSLEGIEVFK